MAKKDFKDIGTQAANKFFSGKSVVTNEESAQQAQNAHIVHKTYKTDEEHKLHNIHDDKNKYINKQRINLALDDGLLDYLRIMVRLDGVSATKYINKLIIEDMAKRNLDYMGALKLFKQL